MLLLLLPALLPMQWPPCKGPDFAQLLLKVEAMERSTNSDICSASDDYSTTPTAELATLLLPQHGVMMMPERVMAAADMLLMMMRINVYPSVMISNKT